MSAEQKRELGLAQLSMLSAEPPRLVELAAEAGFDFIGVRVRAVTDQERPYDLQPGSPMLTETLARMADTGVRVRDVEFLLLDGSDQRSAWLDMLEAGQALSASSMTVAVADREPRRVIDTLAQMVHDAAPYGIIPALEPISYQGVHSLPDAAAIAEQTGADVLVDTLHVGRFNGTSEQLTSVAPRVPLLQLCDAPTRAPIDRDGLVEESRSERLPPGDGGLDLVGMLRATETGRLRDEGQIHSSPLAVSVEVPNNARQARMDATEWVNYLKASTLKTLGETLK